MEGIDGFDKDDVIGEELSLISIRPLDGNGAESVV